MFHFRQEYKEIMANQTFYSKNNQNIFDICIQTYGDLNKMYKLVQDSNFESISKSVVIGTPFIFNDSLISNYPFYNQINGDKQIINTNTENDIDVVVFGTEDLQTIFISEDGSQEFTYEN